MNPNRSMRNILQGMRLAESLAIAERVGCTVRHDGRGYHWIVIAPSGRQCVVKPTRKHPSMPLLKLIRSVDPAAFEEARA